MDQGETRNESSVPCFCIGFSRGIGLGLVKQLLAREAKVIATAREPDKAVQLTGLRQHASTLLVTELDVASPTSIKSWAEKLKDNVQHIDVSNCTNLRCAPQSLR